jgi:hypothetical protein
LYQPVKHGRLDRYRQRLVFKVSLLQCSFDFIGEGYDIEVLMGAQESAQHLSSTIASKVSHNFIHPNASVIVNRDAMSGAIRSHSFDDTPEITNTHSLPDEFVQNLG